MSATSVRVPRADCVTPSQVSILELFAGNFVGDLLSALQTTFPYVSPFGFMSLVHKLENIHFWRGNELFTSDSRSFHGLPMVAL